MAYKGGYYVKPVDVDFDGLVNLYSQGKAKAEQSREVRRQDRAKQLADLTKASTFEHTGIEDIDQAYMQAGQIAAQAIQDAHRANIAGEGTLAYANGEFSHQMTQIGVLGKQVELVQTRLGEIDQRIADGEASVAEKNQFINSLFPRKGMLGTVKLEDGTEREAKKFFSFGHRKNKNGFNDLVVNVTQEFQDEDGNVQVYRGQRGLTEALSPNRELVNRVTVIDKAKDINKVFGDREFYVDPVTGLSIPSPVYKYNMTLSPSGEALYVRGITQETFGDVRNTVETNIKGTSRLEYISMLAELGARSPIDADFNGYRDVDVVNNMYAGMYDENGNPLQFKSDPLVLGVDGSMNYFLTEDNKKFIDAMLRDNIYKGMDVTAEEIRSGILNQRGGSTAKVDSPMTNLGFSYVDPTQGSVEAGLSGSPLAAEYFRDLVMAEFIVSDAVQGTSNAAALMNVDTYLQRGLDQTGTLFNTYGSTHHGTEANQPFDNVSADISKTMVHGAAMSNFAKIYPKLNPTTLAGYEMTDVTGMVAVKTGQGYSVHWVGQSDIADMKRQWIAGGGSGGGAQFNVNNNTQLTGLSVKRIPSMSKPLSPSELTSSWIARYDNDPDFKAKADAVAAGYNITGQDPGRNPVMKNIGGANIGPKNWWYEVLELYK